MLVHPSRAGQVAKDIQKQQHKRRVYDASEDIRAYADFTEDTALKSDDRTISAWLDERDRIMGGYWSEKKGIHKSLERKEAEHNEMLQKKREDLERRFGVDKLRGSNDPYLSRTVRLVDDKLREISRRGTRRLTKERSRSFRVLQSKREDRMKTMGQSLAGKSGRASSPPGRW